MKFFLAFTALVAVAVASPLIRTKPATNELTELEAIIAAIQSPNTDLATAALLEEQLAVIVASLNPIAVGPAIIETHPISVGPAIIDHHPISVGPAIIDFPLPDGGDVTAIEPSPVVVPSPVIVPSPVVVGEIPAGSTPLVQIIVNVNGQQESVVAPVAPAPVDTPVIVEEAYVPGPVNVVDSVDIAEPIIVEPVQVVNPIVVEPVQVVNPIVVAPVQVGTPIIPAPAVVLPDILN